LNAGRPPPVVPPERDRASPGRPIRTDRQAKEWDVNRRIGRGLAGLAVAGAVVGLLAGDAAAGPRSKESRQIRLFETIVDEMLVESPNWLVQGRDDTRGTYVEGHGAIFTFDASLVNGDWGWGRHDKWWDWWDDDEDRVIIIGRDRWDDDDDEAKDDDGDRRDRRDDWYDREMKRQERRYERGKSEIVEMIVDFGDVLTMLADTEYLEIEAFLERAEYFYEKDLDQLSMRVKMADVRAFADGKIDEKTLVQRIETKES
jgi:hypothetical protein